MTAQLLSGKEVAAVVRGEVKERVTALAAAGRTVGLATVLVGEDEASQVYVRGKHRAATAAGMLSFARTLPADATSNSPTNGQKLSGGRITCPVTSPLKLAPATIGSLPRYTLKSTGRRKSFP